MRGRLGGALRRLVRTDVCKWFVTCGFRLLFFSCELAVDSSELAACFATGEITSNVLNVTLFPPQFARARKAFRGVSMYGEACTNDTDAVFREGDALEFTFDMVDREPECYGEYLYPWNYPPLGFGCVTIVASIGISGNPVVTA